MKRQKLILWSAAALVVAGLFFSGLTLVQAQPAAKADSPPPPSKAAGSNAPAANPKPAKPKHQITGAELYSINCNRCHQERYPTERTGAQWKTIMLHMQVRANIPVSQANLILQYLQENSGR
jgi:hypothetical protein